MMIAFKLMELSHCCCSKRIIHIFQYLNKAADGELLDLYLKTIFKKILWNETEFSEHLNLLHLEWKQYGERNIFSDTV